MPDVGEMQNLVNKLEVEVYKCLICGKLGSHNYYLSHFYKSVILIARCGARWQLHEWVCDQTLIPSINSFIIS